MGKVICRSPREVLSRLVMLIDHPSFEESIKPGEHIAALRESGEMEDARETLRQWAEITLETV